MYMKDKDIAEVLEYCAQVLKGFDETATVDEMKQAGTRVAETLEGLVKDLREW